MTIRTWFGNQPIQNKLILINIIVILAALIPIFGIMLSYEYYAVKSATLREIQVQAAIISDSAAAAMAFGDKKSAAEALTPLRASPDVLQAELTLPNGNILATYRKQSVAFPTPTNVNRLTWGRFKIYTDIYLQADHVGKLMVESSLASFYSRMSIYFLFILLISSAGLALSIWLASVLQRSITGPLSFLTALTHQVTTDENYSVQPMAERTDEIGGLSRAFGDMISHVQERIKLIARESEQLFRTLAENTPDMLIRYDLHYRRVFVNQEYLKMTGFTLEQILDKELGAGWLASNMSSNAYKAKLTTVIKTGVSNQILLEWIGVDGKLISYDMYVVAERNVKGQIVGVLAFGRNISALKEIERNLDESQALILEWSSIREHTLENERKRIAREIHDELGQLLTLLRLKIQMLPLKLEHTDQLPERIAEVVTVVDSSIKAVRSIARSLRPAVLDSGIIPALKWLVDEFVQHSGIACKLDTGRGEAPTDDYIIVELFRIAQESLTNVARHAQATEVIIKLHKTLTPPQFVLEITDNGKGFNLNQTKKRKSLGLMGMHERVRLLSGELSIISNIGQGTLLRICIPNNKAMGDKNDSIDDRR